MRKIVCFIIILSFLIVTPCYAKVIIPENVKIGLYYGTSAVSVINVNGQNGTIVGFNDGEHFEPVYETSSTKALSIRKDAYFVRNGSIVLEFKPTDTTIPNGEKYGPYHIQIGSSYSDKDLADKKINDLKDEDIEAYPVYSGDKWYVYYGFFLDADTAQQEIDSVLKPALWSKSYTVIQPTSTKIQVWDGDNVVLLFDGEESYLGVRPKRSSDIELIHINGKKFRGEVEIRRITGSDMTVINKLPLEEYLYGVVPREIGGNSPIEAVKAQAVAARNYAVKNIGKNAKWGFDMTNTVSDQAYSGYEWEVANSNKAVDETKGKVLLYDGKIAELFYFSTSGGRTEDVKNVWNSKGDYPYLVSVEDKYEPYINGNTEWEVTLTGEELGKRLKQNGYDLGEITEIKAIEYTDAGRVLKLYVKGTKGEKIFEKSQCQSVIRRDSQAPNTKEIKSQWYTITYGSGSTSGSGDLNVSVMTGDGTRTSINLADAKIASAEDVDSASRIGTKFTVRGGTETKQYTLEEIQTAPSEGFTFKGRGWGHGIGMSQNGAIGMAKAGFKYDEILEWYFKGTYVE